MMAEDSTPRSERGFWHLAALQFQGAASDNIFRIALMLIAGQILVEGSDAFGRFNALLTILFPASYLLFSVWAGFLADRFSKRAVTLATKLAEVGLMALGVWAFRRIGNMGQATAADLVPATVVLFLMFTQSAFFSPSKYGIIPELVESRRLAWANGIIGAMTYLAIILGATAATGLVQWLMPASLHWIPALLVGLALAGWAIGLGIDRVAPANPTQAIVRNPLPELAGYFRFIFENRPLRLTVLGLAYFWGLGAVLLAHMLVWARDSLGYVAPWQQGSFFLLLALGIGTGSALAGRVSRGRIEVGLVPLGALGMGIFSLPLALARPGLGLVMALLVFLLGVSAGLFSVPLNALLQHLTPLRKRGGLIAANNYVTNTAILAAGLIYLWLNSPAVQFPPNGIFLLTGVITLTGMVIIISIVPEALVRLIGFLLARLVYRIRVLGAENLPREGAALLVSNHVSYVDALLINAISPRPVRFIAFEGQFRKPLLGWLLRMTRSIPIGSQQSPRELIRSLRAAREELDRGEIVCIFAEGQVTRTGMMLPFRRGFEQIVRGSEAPIIPINLHGVWGSIFSFAEGKFIFKWPRRIPYPVTVALGRPLPATASTFALRQAIEELAADCAIADKADAAPLHHGWVRNARRRRKLFAMGDTLSPDIPLGHTLLRAVVLARRLRDGWAGQENVGVLLPPSVGGALVNYAAALGGRTVVNLNYTTGQEVFEHCIAAAGLRSIVTSRGFMEKLGEKLRIPEGIETIWLEDLRGLRGGFGEIVVAAVAARLMPVRMLERFCGAIRRPTPDTPATIIFSSGSTGTPKGVVLTHYNVLANVESFGRALHIWPHDRMLGVLPFFHSFGYTVSLWGGALLPFGSVFHYNPLDLKTIGELVEGRRVTLLISTPTFMMQYVRRIPPGQFGGLSAVVSGAERLPDSVREAFLERFGQEPLQGYGTTECSPVVAVNVPDHRSPGLYQVGHKRGSVGHPLPGIAVRTVDPVTGESTAEGEAGLLQVKGPNVMAGYLGLPEKTAEVLREGWYDTGDMARIDEDGFIFITGRLSRFSKIGGEMVPHVGVEDKLREALAPAEGEELVVTAVADEKKGEQLVVLHTLAESKLEGLAEKLGRAGLPNLWVPRKDSFFRVEAIPVLGTGKLDLQGVGRLARELAQSRRAEGAGEPEAEA